MAFIGDLVDVPDLFFPSWMCTPMATAIFSAFTPDGFLVAADGRASRSRDHTIASDTQQKIFELRDQAGVLACSFKGSVVLSPTEDSDEVALDLRTECIEAAKHLAGRGSKSLYGYAARLSKAVNAKIEAAKTSGAIDKLDSGPVHIPGETGDTIARFWLAGYYHGRACRAHIRFSHIEQKLNEPTIETPPTKGEWFSGSSVVSKLLFETDDERFSRYRVKEPTDMLQMIRRGRGFVEAHSNAPSILQVEEWSELERMICTGIGGHIHMAIVDLNGFRWIEGFGPPPGSN
jgi:hypothetical protein